MPEDDKRPGSSGQTLSKEALDFAPHLLAIQERPPSRLPRTVLWSVSSLLLLLLLWAAIAKRDIVVSAQGRLVPQSFTKVVQPAEPGVVTEVLVADGDFVQAGQVLLRLDARIAQAESTAFRREQQLRSLTKALIDAELHGAAPAIPTDFDAALVSQVRSQFAARRQAFDDAVRQESESLRRAQSDLAAAQQVLNKLNAVVPTYKQSAMAFANLHAEGFVGELAAAEKQRDLLEKQQDAKAQQSTVDGLSASIAVAERRIAALRSQYRSQLEGERTDAIAQLNRLNQEVIRSTVKSAQMELRAPHAGVVKDLAVTGNGTVVAAGGLLLNIVPTDDRLQAEVFLHNEDLGFVAAGQLAMVKVAAFPFQKYGLLAGAVTMVSADTSNSREAAGQAQEPRYRILVSLDQPQDFGRQQGQALRLSAGMLVSAEIHQGRQTMLEYLLSPVLKVAHEAARER